MEEICKQIEQYALLQFSVPQIETIVGLEKGVLAKSIKDEDGLMYKSYMKGTLLAEAQLRQAIFDGAKSGSATATKQFLALIDKREKTQKRNR